MVCKERPIACRTNATFVLDTSSLEQRDDDKADDNRSFRHHRKKIEFVELNDGDVVNCIPHGRAKKNPRPFFTTASGTRMKISKKASSSMGPSSIYDQLYQEAGDVLSRKASANVPRSIDQVKYERKKLQTQHEKDQLAELISLSNNGFV